MTSPTVTQRRGLPTWLVPALLGVVLLLLLAACFPTPTPAPGATPAPTPTPTLNPAAIPLAPAVPDNPINFLAWLFTPIFQVFFIILVFFDQLTGNIAIAIVLLTLLLKIVLIPVFRRQTVSTKRMQMLGPELKELQKRYKGDAVKAQQAQREFYRERGVNPLAGCLPTLLQLLLLIPMYSVFSQGLTNYDVTRMVTVFGVELFDLNCPTEPMYDAAGHVIPCLDPIAFGINWGLPEVIIGTAGGFATGLSIMAVISALLQLIASRMALPAPDARMADDQNTRIQRQMALLFPFISLTYGSLLPAGLFLYWIVSTLFTIVQQYLIIGWGGMFPFFGWSPSFAQDHTPRFPVALPPPVDPSKRPPTSALGGEAESRAAAANKTIRHRERGRQSRRGRRR
ncbi:MAG TPA: YidC/Oxa1 family membrane protein insertase [Candidatus Limnocylindrales bacterium]|nr:YidC/Oxa1 family membrane protein insertase [Candidatus Limnocylindrales bacterium]